MIVYHCLDLIFATKIRSTAESLGLAARPAGEEDPLAAGPADEAPSVLLVDLEAGEAALAAIERARREHPEVPVLAFGPHVQVELLEAARQRGADEVLPRSAFAGKLPAILKRYAGAA